MTIALAPSRARRAALAYFELTKPRISMLVGMTAVPALLLAAQGMPPLRVFWGALAGTLMAAGSAASFNMYFDRDIDARMVRTRGRPLPSGRLAPASALMLGIALAALSWTTLAVSGNLLAASIGLASIFYYAVIYTVWLKRRTPQNIVIGGAAGAVPPLVGWAATRGSLSWTAVYLFAIVFYWTPPHFWSLSLLMKDEYARVGVPMMPVVRGERETRRQILLYTLLLYAISQLPFCAGEFGVAYLIASMVLGLAFIAGAVLLYRRADRRTALRLYLFSLAYLALLFGAMVADVKL
jgi:protoheme IX farnesyltransferase